VLTRGHDIVPLIGARRRPSFLASPGNLFFSVCPKPASRLSFTAICR
jgi:hypothetical protein